MRSKAEERVEKYLKHLQSLGYVESYRYEPYSFEVTEKVTANGRVVLEDMRYTPDFEVVFNLSAVDDYIVQPVLEGAVPKTYRKDWIFLGRINGAGKIISIIEVKPTFDKNNMTRYFTAIRKILFAKDRIFVNLIKVGSLKEPLYINSKKVVDGKS